MSSILPQGYGSVVIRIYDSDNNIISHKYKPTGEVIPLGFLATNLEYTYDEEGEDNCDISFETDDVSIADNTFLREGAPLRVQWGYIGDKINNEDDLLSPRRLVVVKEVAVAYTEQGIKLTLETCDKLFYARSINAGGSEAKTFEHFLKEMEDTGFPTAIGNEGGFYEGIAEPGTMQMGGNTTDSDNARFQFWVKNTPLIAWAGRSQYQNLTEALGNAPGGPYYVDGTDGKTTIHSRNFNQTPLRIYKYLKEGGDLLSFKPKTNHTVGTASLMVSNDLDTMTKSITSTKDLLVKLKEDGAYDRIHIKADVPQQVMDALAMNQKILARNDNLGLQPGMDGYTYMKTISIFTSTADVGYSEGDNYVSARDNTAVPIRIVIPPVAQANGPEVQEMLEEARKNDRKSATQSSLTATATILGDPSIKSSKIISVENVAEVHSGNWYITKATHTCNPGSGYILTVDLIKTSKTDLVSAATNKATVTLTKTESGVKWERLLEKVVEQNAIIKEYREKAERLGVSEGLDNHLQEKGLARITSDDGDEFIAPLVKSAEDFIGPTNPAVPFYNKPGGW